MKPIFTRKVGEEMPQHSGTRLNHADSSTRNSSPTLKSKPKFKVYGVLEMWEAYHLGKNDGTIKDMEYLLSKKVE